MGGSFPRDSHLACFQSPRPRGKKRQAGGQVGMAGRMYLVGIYLVGMYLVGTVSVKDRRLGGRQGAEGMAVGRDCGLTAIFHTKNCQTKNL